MAAGSAVELQPVALVRTRLQALLERAGSLKSSGDVEPPLPASELTSDIDALHSGLDARYDRDFKFVLVETSARSLLHGLIQSTDIHDPAFVQVWNLLDILLICGDRGSCAPELVCWSIEELLDSQTTVGCRTVFDYLESRRERLAAKDFHKKNLALLRLSNELLRRLSKAEDATFCGRVFFFLFQTFPLGDKSSVNLRGEFHVENTTKFEVSDGDQMDVDTTAAKGENAVENAQAETPQPPTKPGAKAVPVTAANKPPEEVVLTNTELYPLFWRLQQDFSVPTRLFATEHFATFKTGLTSTLAKFKKTATVTQTKATEDSKRGIKRKLGEDGSDGEASNHLLDNYNPKYLTSRDLFDLELSDLAFQRHIMIQALILLDFLLSLTEKAKNKLAAPATANKSMLYNFTLSVEDAKWATDIRVTITTYLQQLPNNGQGRFYHRMVETILARDRNWVRWKIDSCPSIVRDPVSTEQELEARKGARDATRLRRIPDRPPGAIDLSFLDEGQGGGLEALKDPSRFTAPSVGDLIKDVETDKLDLEMAMDEGETASLENAISNKTWRALRQVRASNLRLLNKVDLSKGVEEIFEPSPGESTQGVAAVPVEDSGLEDPTLIVTAADDKIDQLSGEAQPATAVNEDVSTGVATSS